MNNFRQQKLAFSLRNLSNKELHLAPVSSKNAWLPNISIFKSKFAGSQGEVPLDLLPGPLVRLTLTGQAAGPGQVDRGVHHVVYGQAEDPAHPLNHVLQLLPQAGPLTE